MNREIKGRLKCFLYMILMLTLATGGGFLFHYYDFQEVNTVLLYIVAVFLIARYSKEPVWGIVSSFLATAAFNFFFIQPEYSFSVDDGGYMVTFVCMVVVAVFTGTLTMETRRNADRVQERELEIQQLYHMANELSSADAAIGLEKIAIKYIEKLCPCRVEVFFGEENSRDKAKGPGKDMHLFEISGHEGRLGVIGIEREVYEKLQTEGKTLLHTMLENIGIALDRVRSSEERYWHQELMEQEKYRANLLRSISHDFRTPLMGIMGTAEMIRDMSAPEDPRRQLAIDINQDADWLHSLVENVLGLTRLQSNGTFEKGARLQNRTAEALEELIASAVYHVEKTHPPYEIEVELPEEYIEVQADARLISQVFTNILDNAVRHTTVDEEIKLIVRKKTEELVDIIIQDGGEGIEEEDLPHLFEMFYTSAQKPADVKRGIGLGLAISSMVVQAHGGDIHAANRQDGKGAVFTVTLPVSGMKGEERGDYAG